MQLGLAPTRYMGVYPGYGPCAVRCYARHQVFYPGNVVEGVVELVVKAPAHVVALRVKATGKERVVARRPEGVLCESRVVYKQLITLEGQMRCSGNRQPLTVPPGRYTYPFAFQLPQNLPPSMARRVWNDEADILYYIKAYVELPFGRDAFERQWLTIIRPMPATQWDHGAPTSLERTWNLGMCCFDMGTTRVRFELERSLLAIDRDTLRFTLNVDNRDCRRAVPGFRLSLMHILNYKTGPVAERHLVREGSAVINDRVEAGAQGRLQGSIPLTKQMVPTLVIWNITSEYYLTVELRLPGVTQAYHNFPIIIAQAVDETNYSPPVTWNGNQYSFVPKGCHPEFFYLPPPNPCYPLNPIPVHIAPPPGVIGWNGNMVHAQLPLPPDTAGWGAPNAGAAGPMPQAVQWQAGLEAEQQPGSNASTSAAPRGQPGRSTADAAAPVPAAQPAATPASEGDPSQPLLRRT